MGQGMATPLVPVSITPKALAPGDIAQNGVGSEDNAISYQNQRHDNEG